MEEENIVYNWEIGENDFKEVIKETRPEIRDVAKFWQEHHEKILDNFDRRFCASLEFVDIRGMIENAVDESIEVGCKSGKT